VSKNVVRGIDRYLSAIAFLEPGLLEVLVELQLLSFIHNPQIEVRAVRPIQTGNYKPLLMTVQAHLLNGLQIWIGSNFLNRVHIPAAQLNVLV